MAISVDKATNIIYVPRADMPLLVASPELREFDVDAFRLDLKALEAGENGMPYSDSHSHNTAVTLSGIVYSRTVEILEPYTIEFEDAQYTVSCINANHNIADVKVANQVSLIIGNSAGLQTVVSGSGVTEQDKLDIADAVWDEILTGASHNVATSAGRRLRQLGDAVSGDVSDASPSLIQFETNLVGYADNFFNDQMIRFTTGNLAGLVRAIIDYAETDGVVIVEEDMIDVPDNGSEFDIVPVHIHPVTQIAQGIWDHPFINSQDVGTFGEAISDMLGLGGENTKWTNTTFDANHNLTSATITQYEDNTLAVVEKAWTVTATYNESNEMTAYQRVDV